MCPFPNSHGPRRGACLTWLRKPHWGRLLKLKLSQLAIPRGVQVCSKQAITMTLRIAVLHNRNNGGKQMAGTSSN